MPTRTKPLELLKMLPFDGFIILPDTRALVMVRLEKGSGRSGLATSCIAPTL